MSEARELDRLADDGCPHFPEEGLAEEDYSRSYGVCDECGDVLYPQDQDGLCERCLWSVSQ